MAWSTRSEPDRILSRRAEVFGAAHNRGWSPPVYLISTTSSLQVRSEEGLRLTADYSIYNAPALDVLIATSAYDMSPQLENADLIDWLQTQQTRNLWLSSNCSGAFLLAESGALDGERATTWAGGEAELQAAYEKVLVQTDVNVVIDGRIVTSNGGAVSYEAALQLLEKITDAEKSAEIRKALQVDRLGRVAR